VSGSGWIGVDLDGTLAHYEQFQGLAHIGEPIPAMVARVQAWLADGREVRIFTARVTDEGDARDLARVRELIGAWCEKHIGRRLPITNVKDYSLDELWDDRAVQVVKNTGIAIQDLVPKERA
jgi:hypothetical protein